MRNPFVRLVAASIVTLWSLACGGGDSGGGGAGCVQGQERCPCFSNGTCFAGLTCASNACVRVGGDGGGGAPQLGSGGSGNAGAGGTNAAGGAFAGNGGTIGGDGGAISAGGVVQNGSGGSLLGFGGTGSGGATQATDAGSPPSGWKCTKLANQCTCKACFTSGCGNDTCGTMNCCAMTKSGNECACQTPLLSCTTEIALVKSKIPSPSTQTTSCP